MSIFNPGDKVYCEMAEEEGTIIKETGVRIFLVKFKDCEAEIDYTELVKIKVKDVK